VGHPSRHSESKYVVFLTPPYPLPDEISPRSGAAGVVQDDDGRSSACPSLRRSPSPALRGDWRNESSRRWKRVRGEIAVRDPLNALRKIAVRLDELFHGSERFLERDVEADGNGITV